MDLTSYLLSQNNSAACHITIHFSLKLAFTSHRSIISRDHYSLSNDGRPYTYRTALTYFSLLFPDLLSRRRNFHVSTVPAPSSFLSQPHLRPAKGRLIIH